MTDDTEQLPEGITLIIDQPPNGTVIDISQTTISGRGLIGNESVRITLTGNFTPLTFTTHARLGVWSLTLPHYMPAGAVGITAFSAIFETRVSITTQFPAPIIEPQEGTGSQVNGSGLPDTRIEVTGTGTGEKLALGVTTVAGDGRWHSPTWLPGFEPDDRDYEYVALARFSIGTQTYASEKSLPQTYISGLRVPVIELPRPDDIQDMAFTLSGTAGVIGAIVKAFIDFTDVQVGQSGKLTEAAWVIPLSLEPGVHSLTVYQDNGILQSKRSVARAVKIRPLQLPAPSVVFLPDGGIKFSGTGLSDAMVDINILDGPGGTEPVSVKVVGGNWETTALDWRPGEYQLSARQRISDNSGGWIDSLPLLFTLNKELQPVREVTDDGEYRPTFSGEGVDRATVSLFAGAEIATPVVVRNRQWSTQALESWGPTNKRKISIRQELDGSEGWLEYEISILPREPGIDVPPEDGLNPVFSGTCWPGAVVNISFSDSNHSFTATVVGETWTFCRPTPFTDGLPCTIEATQTVVGLTSEPGSLTFKVYRERLKPAIRTPLPEQETDSDLTVTGDFGMAGASMRLWNLQDGKPLGDPVVLGQDGPWSVRLTGLAIKTWFITAQQTLNDRASPDSEVRQFDVVVMPPEFVRPLPGGDLTRTAVLSGTGRRDGLVTVWRRGLDEPLLRDVQIGVDGTWEASVVLEVGDEILWATQTFEGKTSKPSLDVPCRVVPVAVMPESPTPEEFLGATVTVSGFGVPGDLITLKRGECVLGTAPVLDDASWSIPATLELPDGAVTLSVMASKGEYHSVPSEWECQVRLFLPQFIYPGPGLWVSPLVAVTGLGKPGIGTLLSWYSADVLLAGPITVTDAGWTASPTEPLHSGAQWCRFRQISDTGAPMSDDAESGRFDVRVDSPDNA
ncbi:hypothetical protein LOY57_20540 [Pseudomonas moraviensis]|uniref:hypothetical protein n=1 Tax=Pseudomonas moraviensis TaxID=321662 RepID=UPI00215FBDB0|nr:hypothetical protein [Pseudomonas moraviensis]UVL45063.1 hypothetical protein LOY57_20540 [Pseudomonas moraviensis]